MELAAALTRLSGLTCCGVIAGGSAGSVVNIELGARRPRARPLTNTLMRPEQRAGISEVSVMVHCSWRLESLGRPIFGSGDDDSLRMVLQLDALVGATLQHVETPHDRDLILTFDRDLTFRAFADIVTVDDPTNYVIYVDDDHVTR